MQRIPKEVLIKLCGLSLVAILAFMISLHSGAVHLSWQQVFSFLFGNSLSQEDSFLLIALRVPRTVATFVIGAALGVSGLTLQTILKNPLAEPYTLGLAGGSSLGAIVALYLGVEPAFLWVPAFSTLGCLGAAFLVLGLGQKRLQFESRSLILFGIMISLFFGALVVTGLSILSPVQLQSALFWLLGQFGTSRDVWIYRISPILFFIIFLVSLRAQALDALSLGEARAFSLGYSPKYERALLIFFCTLMTALAVSISGLVGFIGLVSPHLSRRILITSQHRVLIVGTALTGASLLTLADSLARILGGSTEIPAGSIAALIGAPLLIALLLNQNSKWVGYASPE